MTGERGRVRRGRLAAGLVLAGVPILVALVGPFVAGSAPAQTQVPFGPSEWSWFGTDRMGRDVLASALVGGRALLVTAAVTVVGAYAAGLLLGLAAAAARRDWLEEVIMRPIDVLLCLPGLLVVLVAALRSDGSRWVVAVAVGSTLVAPITRFVRMAARDVVQGPAMEALRMQGAGHWDRYGRHALHRLARPLGADVGVRFVAAIYVLASANFLGVGFDTTSPDWAVAVAANKDGLALAPWSVWLPAALIVSLVLGLNLCSDEILADPMRRRLRREGVDRVLHG